MLNKTLALWIVLLAASPLTQPFSTITFARLRVDPTGQYWTVPATPSASIGDDDSRDASLNPPVELRQACHSEQVIPLEAASHPVAHSPRASSIRHVVDDSPAAESGTIGSSSVLRL